MTSGSPVPMPWKFPPPFVTPLSIAGLKAALLLFRKGWDEQVFDEVLVAANCLPPPAVLAALSPDDRSRQTRTGRTNWYRGIANNDTLAKKLREFVESRATPAGYSPLLLAVKSGREHSYEVLLELVHTCGLLASSQQLNHGDEHPLMPCARLLASLTRTHCWTLYDWSQRQRRPRLVAHHGLMYPQAVVGSSVLSRHIQRLLLADGTGDRIYVGKLMEGATGFAKREQIEEYWSVPIRWPNGRSVLFLNWRNPNTQKSLKPTQLLEAKPAADIGWRDQGHPIREHADIDVARPQAVDPDDLLLGLRYLSGWLASVNAAPLDDSLHQTPVSAKTVQRSLVTLFEPWLGPSPSQSRIRLRVNNLKGLRAIILDVLRDVEHAQLSVFGCNVDGDSLIIDRDDLVDWRGRQIHTGKIRLAPGQRDLVPDGASLIAQSLAWTASLHLTDVPPDIAAAIATVESDPLGVHSLLRRRLWTAGRITASELAVPIFAGRRAIGGLSVEARAGKSLLPSHLHWLEAISMCAGSLVRLCTDSGLEQEGKYVAECFVQATTAPSDYDSLWSVLSDWAIKNTGADLVHVTRVGHAIETRTSCAVRVSQRLCDSMAAAEGHQLHWIPSHLRSAMRSRVAARVADALSPLLVESEAGHSKRLLAGSVQRWEWNGSTERATKTLADRMLSRATAFALGPHEDAAPSAVLWMAHLKQTGGGQPLPSSVDQELERRMRRLGELVASLDFLYRVSDPS